MNTLITGTSSGIGQGLALELLKKDEHVYGISRRKNPELETYPNYHHLSIDLTEFDKVPTAINQFISGIQDLGLVILNAGTLPPIADLSEMELAELKKVMDINLWANKVIIDTLSQKINVKQIVGISSGAAVSGARGWNAYALSKAAFNMLISLYAKELPEIHFCAMAPGLIDTSMQDYISSLPDDERFPVFQKLKKAKGTAEMPSPEKASNTLLQAFETALDHESGSFLDLRKMDIK
jgi:NAD(P)-dependent dehydrogenase (short-subunit alcohol dehydrogenase family)